MRASPGYVPAIAFGADLAAGAETMPRIHCDRAAGPDPGEADFYALIPRANQIVSQFVTQVRATPTVGATLARMALYSETDAGDLTMLARTDDIPAMFSAIGAVVAPMSTAGGFPGSYTLRAGRRYRIAAIHVGSAGTLGLHSTGTGFSGAGAAARFPTPYRYLLAQTDLLPAYAAAAVTGLSDNMVWAALV